MLELATLVPTVEAEFLGQINLSRLNEMNIDQILVMTALSEGFYARTSFTSRVSVLPFWLLTPYFFPSNCR